MARAVGVGFSCIDVFEKPGSAYPAGSSVNFCLHLSRMGVSTALVSAAGSDAYGAIMVDTLAQTGIDLSHLHIKDGETARRMWVRSGRERIFRQEIAGVMADFSLSDEDIRFITDHELVYTDLFGRVLHLLPAFKAHGVKIGLDFSVFFDDPAYHADDVFPFVDYWFGAYGQRDQKIEALMQKIQRGGPGLVTVTLGKNGSLCFDGRQFHEYGIVPAQKFDSPSGGVPIRVANSKAYGDAYNTAYLAGFMYGVLQGWAVPECMKNGAETSATAITHWEA